MPVYYDTENAILAYLKCQGDRVVILGVCDTKDSLGYDQVISVNGGPPQRVDGTPFTGEYSLVNLEYRLEMVMEATWLEK